MVCFVWEEDAIHSGDIGMKASRENFCRTKVTRKFKVTPGNENVFSIFPHLRHLLYSASIQKMFILWILYYSNEMFVSTLYVYNNNNNNMPIYVYYIGWHDIAKEFQGDCLVAESLKPTANIFLYGGLLFYGIYYRIFHENKTGFIQQNTT